MQLNAIFLTDDPEKIGAGFLVFIGSTTEVLKKEFNKIEDLSWKDEMAI
jgi:hypothetical protein